MHRKPNVTAISLLVFLGSPLAATAAPPAELKAVGLERLAAPSLLVARKTVTPAVAAGGDGKVFVVGFDPATKDYLLHVSADGGKTFAAPTVAIATGGRGYAGAQRGPRVGVDGRGTVYVSAAFRLEPKGADDGWADVYLAASLDGGKSFGKPVRVNDAAHSAPEMYQALAVTPSGEAWLAWLDHRFEDRGQVVYAARAFREASGALQVGPNLEVYSSPKGSVCECCNVAIAADAKGRAAVAFRNSLADGTRDAYVALLEEGGKKFGPARKAGRAAWKTSACPMDAPAVACSAEGAALWVAWMDRRVSDSDPDVRWARAPGGFRGETDADEVLERPLLTKTSGRQGHPALAIGRRGDVIAVWEDARPGFQAIVMATSARPDRNFLLTEESEGKASWPAVAVGERAVIVAYEAGGDVKLRLVTPES